MRYALAAVISLTASSATAEPFAAQMARLCGRLEQDTCWLKPGSQFCSADSKRCEYLLADEPVQVLRKNGSRLTVRTGHGVGTVPMSAIIIADH